MVGVPVLGLLGILEAGRGLAAPVSIGGEWAIRFDRAPNCRVPAVLNISQSGREATVTLGDGRLLRATLDGATLSAASLRAAISGKPASRGMAGSLDVDRCGSLAFHAVRRATKNGAE